MQSRELFISKALLSTGEAQVRLRTAACVGKPHPKKEVRPVC